MELEEVNVNVDELKKWKEENNRDRINFIKFWVEYIKTHRDSEWSKDQGNLIDSQIMSASRFTIEQ
ncbi:hypothetical protein J4466_03195 [Candidatus Pacearchaeota archaeon]|nr:hypothetical protein [Candidatus Pacearchaeota archaeon]